MITQIPNPGTTAKPGRSLAEFGLKTPDRDFWVFAYGSLMWDPGFAYRLVRPAQVMGYHRDFAMRSVRHRGTPQRPGLVLALCPGGSCVGRAFLVDAAQARAARSYLLEREIGTYAYRPAWIELRAGGQALSFLPTKSAPQFVPRLSLDAQAQAIASAHGGMGSNLAYLQNTLQEMRTLGLELEKFQALEAKVLTLQRAAAKPPS